MSDFTVDISQNEYLPDGGEDVNAIITVTSPDTGLPAAAENSGAAEISGSRWQASTADVRTWALNAGFEIGADGSIPEQAITAYNQTHPGRPY